MNHKPDLTHDEETLLMWHELRNRPHSDFRARESLINQGLLEFDMGLSLSPAGREAVKKLMAE